MQVTASGGGPLAKKKRPAPVPHEFSVQHAGGSSEFSKFISKNKVHTDVIEVPPGRFPACPICLARDPDSDEHLPPGALGGTVMTSTCTPCNTGFGTAEEELRRYLELEVRVRAESTSAGPVRGHRSATVALRSTPGRPAGAFVKTAAPEFHELIASGPSQLRVEALDMNLVCAAALKQAYLAACLFLREVPTTAGTQRARKVLLAARDREASALGAHRVPG